MSYDITFCTYKKCKNPTPVKTLNPKTGKYEECGVYSFDSKGALKALEQLDKHIGVQGVEGKLNNNLLQQIIAATGAEVNTDDIPEQKIIIKWRGKELLEKWAR